MKNAIAYTLIFISLQLLGSLATLAIVRLAPGSTLALSPYTGIAIMAVVSIATIALFTLTGWASASARYLQSRPWTVVAWSVVAALGSVVPSTALQEALPALPNIIEEEMARLLSTRGGYFVVCLLAPVVEETVFRGAVLRALLEWQPARHWAMIALSAALFALVHMNPAQMPHAFVIGLLLGWTYWRTGSIVPAVAFHWANNTVAYVLFRLYPDPSLQLIDLLGTERNVGAAVIFSLFMLLPALYQLHLNMKREQ